MTDDKIVSLMGDARLIAACDNVIFPLIKKRIEDRVNLICGKFRNGETNFVADVAYITAMKEISLELEQKQTQGNKAIQALHERQNKN